MQSAANLPQIQSQAGSGLAEAAADSNTSAYLQGLLALSSEFGFAIQAIATNRPAEFLASTRRQESLLVEVVGLRPGIRTNGTQPSSAISHNTLSEIHHAERLLADAAGQLSALLERTAKSIALLARLHSSYLSAYPGAGQPDRVDATWSCEG